MIPALGACRNRDEFYTAVSDWCSDQGFNYRLELSLTRNISAARTQCKYRIAQALTESVKILERL